MIESITSLIIVSSILLGSPGPAPLALAATSATYGFKKSFPFYLGILIGLAAAILGAIFGVAVLLSAFPKAKLFLQVIGASYLIYVAYKIATGPNQLGSEQAKESCPSFLDGFILNLLNPKAYAAFLAIFSQFLIPTSSQTFSIVFTGLVCFFVAVVVDFIWLTLGVVLRKLLVNERSVQIVRVIFAALIIGMVIASFFL